MSYTQSSKRKKSRVRKLAPRKYTLSEQPKPYTPPLSRTRLHPIDQAELDAWWARILAQSRSGSVRGSGVRTRKGAWR